MFTQALKRGDWTEKRRDWTEKFSEPNVEGSCVQEQKQPLVEESEQRPNRDLEAGIEDGL